MSRKHNRKQGSKLRRIPIVQHTRRDGSIWEDRSYRPAGRNEVICNQTGQRFSGHKCLPRYVMVSGPASSANADQPARKNSQGQKNKVSNSGNSGPDLRRLPRSAIIQGRKHNNFLVCPACSYRINQAYITAQKYKCPQCSQVIQAEYASTLLDNEGGIECPHCGQPNRQVKPETQACAECGQTIEARLPSQVECAVCGRTVFGPVFGQTCTGTRQGHKLFIPRQSADKTAEPVQAFIDSDHEVRCTECYEYLPASPGRLVVCGCGNRIMPAYRPAEYRSNRLYCPHCDAVLQAGNAGPCKCKRCKYTLMVSEELWSKVGQSQTTGNEVSLQLLPIDDEGDMLCPHCDECFPADPQGKGQCEECSQWFQGKFRQTALVAMGRTRCPHCGDTNPRAEAGINTCIYCGKKFEARRLSEDSSAPIEERYLTAVAAEEYGDWEVNCPHCNNELLLNRVGGQMLECSYCGKPFVPIK